MKRAAIIISAIFGAVGVLVLAAFIYYFGVDEAVKMIDWAAMGKTNPFVG